MLAGERARRQLTEWRLTNEHTDDGAPSGGNAGRWNAGHDAHDSPHGRNARDDACRPESHDGTSLHTQIRTLHRRHENNLFV